MNLYQSATAHIALAAEHLNLGPARTSALIDAHDLAIRADDTGIRYETLSGEPIFDPKTGGQATDSAGFLRAVERDRPDLLGKTASARHARPTAISPPQGLTAAMIAARAGDPSALAAYENTVTPNRSTTQGLWTRAVAGDKAAMAELDRHLQERR